MNNMFSKSAIWVVVALLLFMLFKQFDTHSVAGGSKTIAYSELLDEVKAHRIKDVVIEGTNITATRADDTKVRATATGLDRGLIGDLRDNGVRFDVKPPEEAVVPAAGLHLVVPDAAADRRLGVLHAPDAGRRQGRRVLLRQVEGAHAR